MASILEELAYGNLSPDVQFFQKDSEYGEALELERRNRQKLWERLGTEDRALLEKYIDAQSEVNRLSTVKHYVYGFKLGLIMTAETFVGMDDLYMHGDAI